MDWMFKKMILFVLVLNSNCGKVQEELLDYFLESKGISKSLKIANFVKRRLEYLQKLPGKVISDLPSNGGVFIFIDDSNLWIGAKQAAGDLQTKSDPRIRIDMGKLISAVARGRTLVQTKIYGSEPPDRDTFWRMYERLGAEVFTFPRSKRVDTQIAIGLEHSSSPFKMMIAVGIDLLPQN